MEKTGCQQKISVISAMQEDAVSICYTDKKENQIFLIYKEIQRGAVAKSYMRKGFLNR
jgi:hypothetical protein